MGRPSMLAKLDPGECQGRLVGVALHREREPRARARRQTHREVRVVHRRLGVVHAHRHNLVLGVGAALDDQGWHVDGAEPILLSIEGCEGAGAVGEAALVLSLDFAFFGFS